MKHILTQKEMHQCRKTYEIHHPRTQILGNQVVLAPAVALVVVVGLSLCVDPLVSYFPYHTMAQPYPY